MEGDIFNTIKNVSLEIVVIAFSVFLLTMLIKWPIKMVTSKLVEEKRKAINSLIILIPIFLSFLLSIFYFGIIKSEWLSLTLIETAFSSWLLSFSIYAIYNRIVILIKGIISGKVKLNDELTKETITFLKINIKSMASKLKIDESELNKISEKISSLVEIKKILESTESLDISKLYETNIQIQALTNEEINLQTQIQHTKNQIESYGNKLYI